MGKIILIKAFHKGKYTNKYFTPRNRHGYEMGKTYKADKGKTYFTFTTGTLLKKIVPSDNLVFVRVEVENIFKKNRMLEFTSMKLIRELTVDELLKFDKIGDFSVKMLSINAVDPTPYVKHILEIGGPTQLYAMAKTNSENFERAVERLITFTDNIPAVNAVVSLLGRNLPFEMGKEQIEKLAKFVFENGTVRQIEQVSESTGVPMDLKTCNKILDIYDSNNCSDLYSIALLSKLEYTPKKCAKLLQKHMVKNARPGTCNYLNRLLDEGPIYVSYKEIRNALLKDYANYPDNLYFIIAKLPVKDALYMIKRMEAKHKYSAAILAVEELAYKKMIDRDAAAKRIKKYFEKATDAVTILEAADSGVLDMQTIIKKILKVDNKQHELLDRYVWDLCTAPEKLKELFYVLSDLQEYDALLYTLESMSNCKKDILTVADKLARSGKAELADYILARFSK